MLLQLVIAHLNLLLLLNDLVAIWQWLRNERLDRERDNTATNLYCFGHIDVQVDFALSEDKRPKF